MGQRGFKLKWFPFSSFFFFSPSRQPRWDQSLFVLSCSLTNAMNGGLQLWQDESQDEISWDMARCLLGWSPLKKWEFCCLTKVKLGWGLDSAVSASELVRHERVHEDPANSTFHSNWTSLLRHKHTSYWSFLLHGPCHGQDFWIPNFTSKNNEKHPQHN